MKRLILTLIILTSTSSLHSMEVPKQLPPITLPLIYHHLSENIHPDIAFYIFCLQPGTNTINTDIPFTKTKAIGAVTFLHTWVKSNLKEEGHCLTIEKLTRNFLCKKVSICDIKTDCDKSNVLHYLALYWCKYSGIQQAELYLQIADNDTWKLLNAQADHDKQTALHCAARKGYVELVKLLLNAAGKHVYTFIAILDFRQKTAFDIATPEVKEIMLTYLQNKQ